MGGWQEEGGSLGRPAQGQNSSKTPTPNRKGSRKRENKSRLKEISQPDARKSGKEMEPTLTSASVILLENKPSIHTAQEGTLYIIHPRGFISLPTHPLIHLLKKGTCRNPSGSF